MITYIKIKLTYHSVIVHVLTTDSNRAIMKLLCSYRYSGFICSYGIRRISTNPTDSLLPPRAVPPIYKRRDSSKGVCLAFSWSLAFFFFMYSFFLLRFFSLRCYSRSIRASSSARSGSS